MPVCRAIPALAMRTPQCPCQRRSGTTMLANGQGASRCASSAFQSLARSRPIAATLLHAVLCSPSCGAEQCHRSCHHSDACESPGPGADRALTGMAWLVQGLTNADGSIQDGVRHPHCD